MTVRFPQSFASTPMVVVTPKNSRSHPSGFTVTVDRVSASSFKVHVIRCQHSSNSWAHNVRICWLAWAGTGV